MRQPLSGEQMNWPEVGGGAVVAKEGDNRLRSSKAQLWNLSSLGHRPEGVAGENNLARGEHAKLAAAEVGLTRIIVENQLGLHVQSGEEAHEMRPCVLLDRVGGEDHVVISVHCHGEVISWSEPSAGEEVEVRGEVDDGVADTRVGNA